MDKCVIPGKRETHNKLNKFLYVFHKIQKDHTSQNKLKQTMLWFPRKSAKPKFLHIDLDISAPSCSSIFEEKKNGKHISTIRKWANTDPHGGIMRFFIIHFCYRLKSLSYHISAIECGGGRKSHHNCEYASIICTYTHTLILYFKQILLLKIGDIFQLFIEKICVILLSVLYNLFLMILSDLSPLFHTVGI